MSIFSLFHMPKDLDADCKDCDFRWFSKGLSFVHLSLLSEHLLSHHCHDIMSSWRHLWNVSGIILWDALKTKLAHF